MAAGKHNRRVTRLLAQVVLLVFLFDLFGVAALQAAPESHGAPPSYSQQGDGVDPQDAPACSHACHAILHFVALPVIPLAVSAAADQPQIRHPDSAVRAVPATAPYRPPRALG
jgi:hypothetical protein